MGENIVSLTARYVDNKNKCENYDNFCKCIENFSTKLGTTGENIEIAMFSKGGRNKWPWRKYLIDQAKS